MSTRTVTTQTELDEAVEAGVDEIMIRSESWVCIEATACRSSMLKACGSSKVLAYGAATVTAYGALTVKAYDTSTVKAFDSSKVMAYNSSTIEAYNSSTVTAHDSSIVKAYNSSTVMAYNSSTVKAFDSSKVMAYNSSTIEAYNSSTVTAHDSSIVKAYNSSTVMASKFVAVHLFSEDVHGDGGHVIDLTAIDMTNAATWCDYHGVERAQHDGQQVAFLYKAVNSAWSTDRGWDYHPGSTPVAASWKPNSECGHGLHFSPRPDQAAIYLGGRAAHFVRVGVRLDELSPISSDKAKARRVVVPCVEVDINGTPIEGVRS